MIIGFNPIKTVLHVNKTNFGAVRTLPTEANAQAYIALGPTQKFYSAFPPGTQFNDSAGYPRLRLTPPAGTMIVNKDIPNKNIVHQLRALGLNDVQVYDDDELGEFTGQVLHKNMS